MIDTPIYDAVEQEYLKIRITNELMNYVLGIELKTFQLTEEDKKEVPLILNSAAWSVGSILSEKLQTQEFDTLRELEVYVGGIIDTLSIMRTLEAEERYET